MADNYRQVMASYNSSFAQEPGYNRFFPIFSNIYSCKGLIFDQMLISHIS